MKMKRIISAFLTLLILLGTLVSLTVVDASALDLIYNKNDKGDEDKTKGVDYTATVKQYMTKTFATPQDKLAIMTKRFEADGYQLWSDELTGEVATVKTATGEILFSNPYDIASSTIKGDQTKSEALSQIIVSYLDNGQSKKFASCEQAAMNGQIKVKNIKNGIRVEYTIGREEARMLVPRTIKVDRLDNLILNVMREQLPQSDVDKNDPDNFWVKKVKSYYTKKDPDDCDSERELTDLLATFPVIKKVGPIYVFDPNASGTELRTIEGLIKTYCPLYTYEQLDKDHEMTEYEGTDRAPALFKMALEYTLDESGMSVRLPANGIRFNETEYQLEYIMILPFMGAGANPNTGYTFFPDGSGTLFRFEDLAGKNETVNGKVYGQDFAYHKITGKHQEVIRYPVFGIVENWEGQKTVETDDIKTPAKYDADGKLISGAEYKTEIIKTQEDKGFVAIIEEGDALAELSTFHMGTTGNYNTVRMLFYPRPKDEYNLKEAISVAQNKTQTVVSKRKYVGNYKIRYIMLSDAELADENDIDSYYEASWEGMAHAYQDYLVSTGVLSRLDEQDVGEGIPLYIETFGTMRTLEKVMSVPVNVMTPLTTFENIKTMYDELSEKGIKNVNFKLTGFANGGMYSTIPYRLNWEKSVGGDDGFADLIKYATEKDFGVFPDFNFAYLVNTGAFDGMNMQKHLVKTIDDRYTDRRVYSATSQSFVHYFDLAVSPAYFAHFYDKLVENYLKYDPIGISVATLGSDLNSDFDEDEPYNREDSKGFTLDIFKKLGALQNSNGKDVSVMVDSGNAYTWEYINHIINAPLDSSRYITSANSVPFLGLVLHGYVEFAGTPINMEGDVAYAFLKAIENGSGLYYTLSYQNTAKLKEDSILSEYYSIRYDIWFDDVVEMYNELNGLLADLQTKLIISHDFLVGERIADADELEADKIEKELAEAAKAAALAEAEAKKALAEALEARQAPKIQAEIALKASQTATECAVIAAKAASKISSEQVVAARLAMGDMEGAQALYEASRDLAVAATLTEKNITDTVKLVIAKNTAIEKALAAGNTMEDIIAANDLKSASTAATTLYGITRTAKATADSNKTKTANDASAAKTAAETAVAAAKTAGKTDAEIEAAAAIIRAAHAATKAYEEAKAISDKADATDEQKAATDAAKATADAEAAKVEAIDATVKPAAEAVVASEEADVAAAEAVIAAEKAAADHEASTAAKTAADEALAAERIKALSAAATKAATEAATAAKDAGSTDTDISSAVSARAAVISTAKAYETAKEAADEAEKLAKAAEAELTSPLGTTEAEKEEATKLRAAADEAAEKAATAKTAADAAAEKAAAITLTGKLLEAVEAKEKDTALKSQLALLNSSVTELQKVSTAIAKISTDDATVALLNDAIEKKVVFDEATETYNALADAMKQYVITADEAIYLANDAATSAKTAAETALEKALKTEELITSGAVELPTTIIENAKQLAAEAQTNAETTKSYAELAMTNIEKSVPYMQAKILLFGETDTIAAKDVVVTKKKAIDTNYNTIMTTYEKIIVQRADALQAEANLIIAQAAYDKAKDAYDDKSATAEQKAQAKIDMVVARIDIIKAETAISTYTTTYTSAKKNLPTAFSLVNKNVADAEKSAQAAETNMEIAETLYNILSSASDTDATLLAQVKSAYDSIKENATEARTIADEAAAQLLEATDAVDKSLPTVEEEDKKTDDEYEVTKYTSDDGRIVLVTYGGKDGNDNAPYRSFILNYNAFAVKTVVNDVEYEIDAFGYLVINH